MSSKKIVSVELERFMPTLNWMLFPFIPSAETIEGLVKFPVKAPLFKKSVHNPPSNLYWDLMDLVPIELLVKALSSVKIYWYSEIFITEEYQ